MIIREAVSVVFMHGHDIFPIKRQNFLRAFPGYTAFPGGKVDPEDAAGGPFGDDLLDQHPPTLMRALVREMQEELGIDIEKLIDSKDITAVDYIGLAVTPEFNPYRFATYFFKIELKEKIEFSVDKNEAAVAEWTTCEKLLADFEQGQVLAVPPVIKVFERLGQDPKISEPINLDFEIDSDNEVPIIESIKGVRQIMPLSNTLPPAYRTNSFLIGDENCEQVLIDPSPKNDEEYRKFMNVVCRYNVTKIMLTHHHIDHIERSTQIATDLNIPMVMSEYTHDKIKSTYKPDYFSNIKVSLIKEGDVLTKTIGKDLLVYEVPGHDEGQLAVAPIDKSWFLAGDLFQGVGTVVIGAPEGDMSRYFKSLEKVIKLNPKCVYPSHGIALGGTYILAKILEHRKMREGQVLILKQQGKSENEILREIYADIPEKLLKYARKNIKSHIKKLEEEDKL